MTKDDTPESSGTKNQESSSSNGESSKNGKKKISDIPKALVLFRGQVTSALKALDDGKVTDKHPELFAAIVALEKAFKKLEPSDSKESKKAAAYRKRFYLPPVYDPVSHYTRITCRLPTGESTQDVEEHRAEIQSFAVKQEEAAKKEAARKKAAGKEGQQTHCQFIQRCGRHCDGNYDDPCKTHCGWICEDKIGKKRVLFGGEELVRACSAHYEKYCSKDLADFSVEDGTVQLFINTDMFCKPSPGFNHYRKRLQAVPRFNSENSSDSGYLTYKRQIVEGCTDLVYNLSRNHGTIVGTSDETPPRFSNAVLAKSLAGLYLKVQGCETKQTVLNGVKPNDDYTLPKGKDEKWFEEQIKAAYKPVLFYHPLTARD